MPTDKGKSGAMRRLRRTGILAVSGAAIIVAVGIGVRIFDNASLAHLTEREAIPTVAVISPKQGLKDQTLVLPGDIRAYFEAPIFARVSGYLKNWTQDIGARVTSGQLLAEIDTPDLDQQLRQAEADLAAANANAELAILTSRRWLALRKTDSVSQQEADEKAGDAAKKQADVGAAQANVDRLRALSAFKRIVAPFDGIVTARETDVGALINSGSGNGVELFRVADIHKMRVYVHVPQIFSGSLQTGMQAELHLPQDPGKFVKASVVTNAHAIDSASRTMLVELEADNAQGALSPGTYAEVHFKLPDNPNILRLPASALLFRQSGMEVATLAAGDKVVLKPIAIGRDLGAEVEVVSGLAPTDRVIDSPSDSIADGETVSPANIAGAEAAADDGSAPSHAQ